MEDINKIIDETSNDMKLGEKVRKNKENIKSIIEENKNINDKYIRLYSDFENFKKRKNSEIEQIKESTIIKTSESILDLYDDIKMSLSNIKDEETINGINLIIDKLKKGISKIGLTEIDNTSYDPDIHDVVSVLSDGNDIIDVISNGYKYNDKIVRYPKVILGKK